MILDDILAEKRRTVARAKEERPLSVVEGEALAADTPRGFAASLRAGDIACIAEFKRRSPSAGWIREQADPAEIAAAYEGAGAAALSVLTDGPFFGGDLADLRRAREAVRLPVLRKDFMVDAYQVPEARAAGADAILLIVSALTDDELASLLDAADRWRLDVLCEAHDAAEVDRAVAVGARIVGVNHRDLRTFQMDMSLTERLRDRIPADRLVVAESGIRTAEDVQRMRNVGVNAILVGENLMRGEDPAAALRALLLRP
ncbi:MAG TPA: indole-3-glycerol phosphate synthase TrpC [Polyangia bacterium]|nr:indole-3-glycerol phosphate synthase TrpC [Polyangia bacterium]